MQHPPSALHNSSPLDSLVRQTSTRRAELPTLDTTPPRPTADPAMQAQYSPILHTRFRTASTGTALTEFGGHDRNRSDAQSTSSWGARDESFRERERDRSREREWDGASQHPGASSWAPGARGKSMAESMYSQASQDYDHGSGRYGNPYRDAWRMGETDTSDTQPGAIPAVIVSEEPGRPDGRHDYWPQPPITQMHPAGRTPSAVQGSVNFSHPRVALVTDRATENRKLEVYKRNQQRPGTAGSSQSVGRSPLSQYESLADGSRPSTSMSSHSIDVSRGVPSAASSMLPSQANRSTPPMTQLPGSHSTPSLPHAASSSRSVSPSNAPPRPPRPASPVSLYSHYSYYPMDSPMPSPTTPHAPSDSPATTHLSPNYVPSRSDKSPPTPALDSQPAKPPSAPQPNLENPQTAQDYLQLGINHHEANRLTESAACFEKSATLDGGCGVGMLMWGLAQRHGWGCPQSEASGFRWLRRAAEVAVEDLERARAGADSGAVKSELVLAIYEVGQSFFRGWGVEKDKKMAVSYFRVAARLGDPDAQQDLAFCLANGKGCKKDKREAAKWYRAAVAQGVSDVGLAWIYKDKYQ